MKNHWRLAVLFALAGAAGLFTNGCASSNNSSLAVPHDDLADFRKVAQQARMAFERASFSLDQVAASGNSCPPPVVASYKKAVGDLEVIAVQARSRAQAIIARGDAYFEDWEDHVEKVQSLRAQALMEERRPQLQETFNRLKDACAQTHGAFQPFLTGLREVRTVLENSPDSISTEPNQNLIHNTQLHGRDVALCVDSVRKNLDDLAEQVREIKVASRH